MRRRIPGSILAALFVLSAIDAGAQEEPPTFRSDAQVVVLDLVATDGKGRPVDNLIKGELQVSEDGEPCEVLSFRLVRAATGPAEAPPPTAEARPDSPPSTATPARASLVVLVFDRLTTETAPLAREGALDLLSRSFPPDTWFAVFKVGYGVHLLAPFTADTLRLHAAIETATLGDPDKRSGPLAPSLPSVAAGPAQAPDQPVNPASPPIPDLRPVAARVAAGELSLARQVEGLDSLYAVLGIARALAVVQGRKSVVYFAEAWHLPVSNQPIYDDAVSAANRANVAIHTVDVRGLTSRKPLALTPMDSVVERFTADSGAGVGEGATTPGIEAGGGLGSGGMALSGMERREEQLSGPRLELLAQDTGGLAIEHTNDLGAGLSGVAEELRQYYEVVYAPANPMADGEFRRIGVKTSRRGVRLRTRTGYFASPGRTATLPAYELPLMDALGARPLAHDFTLRAGTLHFAPKGAERECIVLAEVPLSDVQIASDESTGTYRAHLAFLARIKDEAGRLVTRLTHDWPMEGRLDDREEARLRSAVFRQTLSLVPGRYVLEAAVLDRNSGGTSVTRAPFEVPPTRGGLALASIVLPRRASAVAAGASASDPLRIGDLSLVPGLGAPFEAGAKPRLPVYVGVYPGESNEPVELTVEFSRGGQVLAETSPELPAADASGRIPWLGEIPAEHLPPGSYEIAVTAKRGDAVTKDRTHLEVVPGRRAEVAPAKAPEPPHPDLVPVLERAARYVVAYLETFRNVVAEEHYQQKAWGMGQGFTATATAPMRLSDGSQLQTTRADLVFVRLSRDVPWGLFRDVFEVNGNTVRDRDKRLETLFREPSPSALGQARTILAESARYNIGPPRTVNLPTLALLFLHPRNQSRFSFEKGGRRWFEGFEGTEVKFEEIQRPSLTHNFKGGSVPVSGRFWINPSRGTVLRSETHFQLKPGHATGFIAVEYRREPRLGMWVPSEMKERYKNLDGAFEPFFRNPAEATARYSNYRQFRVTVVDETARVPER